MKVISSYIILFFTLFYTLNAFSIDIIDEEEFPDKVSRDI